MALPPNVFTPVAQGLKKNVYPEKGIARLIVSPSLSTLTQVEKPFGKDLESSRELQRSLAPIWSEDEVTPTPHHGSTSEPSPCTTSLWNYPHISPE